MNTKTPITEACKVKFSSLCHPDDAYWTPAKRMAEMEMELTAANSALTASLTAQANLQAKVEELKGLFFEHAGQSGKISTIAALKKVREM